MAAHPPPHTESGRRPPPPPARAAKRGRVSAHVARPPPQPPRPPPGRPARRPPRPPPPPRTPALLGQGPADPFGSIAELRAAVSLTPAPTQLMPIEQAGHDLRRGRFDLAAVVAAMVHLIE